jgi:hypothetical protein
MSTINRDTVPVDAIRRIVRYLADSEQDDYNESGSARQRGHIYGAVLEVEWWLDNLSGDNILNAG